MKNKIIKSFLGQVSPSPINHRVSERGVEQSAKRVVGAALNSNALLHYNTNKVVYSFNRVNNIYPLLTKTEYLLKSVFRSMFSLISRPIYLIKHDKIIIRLFVYLSPKLDKYLDTSTSTSRSLPLRIEGNNTYFSEHVTGGWGAKHATVAGFSSNVSGFKVRNFLRFKSFRPTAIEILKSQIHALLASRAARVESNTLASPAKAEAAQGKGTYSFLSLTDDISNSLYRFALNEVGGAHNNNILRDSPRYPYTSLVSNFKNSLDNLCLIFEKIFNKKVEFEIIKAQLPFQDSNILAQILGFNANKYKFRQMLKILIPRAVIKNPSRPHGKERLINSAPIITGSNSLSYLSGMNIKLAGRLMTQSMRPRFTVQSIQEGSLARVKVHFIEKSRFTGKNKRGAFSFTVSISHVFN